MLDDKSISTTSQITQASDKILFSLVSQQDPTSAIIKQYYAAENKDVFIAGLVGTLIMRHRQWQAASAK